LFNPQFITSPSNAVEVRINSSVPNTIGDKEEAIRGKVKKATTLDRKSAPPYITESFARLLK
jgi:hypothetical protein